MGVNATALGLMALARADGADFARVITIGRQRIGVSSEDLQHFFNKRGRADLAQRIAAAPGDGYCETLLRDAFGAGEVKSIDASGYENASIVHDMNAPLSGAEQFNVVLDFGTLEHIMNVPTALDNVAALCAPGGHILHVLPANNLAGHGFYQFSPELFFQVYSPERGYEGTRVFAAPACASDFWYEVAPPREIKKRVDLTSRDQLYLLILTRKMGEPVPLRERPVQQSDYVEVWKSAAPKAKQRKPTEIARVVRAMFDTLLHRAKVARKDVMGARADITPRRVLALTSPF